MEKQKTALNWLSSEIDRLTTRSGVHLSWATMNNLLTEATKMEIEVIKISHVSALSSVTDLDAETMHDMAEKFVTENIESADITYPSTS